MVNAVHAGAIASATAPETVESFLDEERELRYLLARFVLPPHDSAPLGCEALLRHQFSQVVAIVSLIQRRSSFEASSVRPLSFRVLGPESGAPRRVVRDEPFLRRLAAAHRYLEAGARTLIAGNPAMHDDTLVLTEVAWRHEQMAEMAVSLLAQ